MRAAVDSGCNESAQLMSGLSNHGVCRLPWKFTALWRCLGDGRALSTHAPLALGGGPYIPICPSVGRNLGELSAGDLPQEDLSSGQAVEHGTFSAAGSQSKACSRTRRR